MVKLSGINCLQPCSLAVPVLAGWVNGFMVLCLGTPEGSTSSFSGLKASQKTGQQLKVSSDRLGEPGNRTCDPWFTRHKFIPYTTAAPWNHLRNFGKGNIRKFDYQKKDYSYRIKVTKGAKIRNQYNQVPHLTQDTNGKVTNSQLDTTKESQA